MNPDLNNDPLFHPQWVEFNEAQWGLKAESKVFGPKKGTSYELQTVIYRDAKGRLVTPPRNPYLPVSFKCTNFKPASFYRRKRTAIEQLANFYASQSTKGGINLSPSVDDIRPFQWAGWTASPRFTYHLNLIDYKSKIDSSISQKIRKAKKLNYTCEVTTDVGAISECLEGPEARKGFDHNVDREGLESVSQKLGAHRFVMFLCRDGDGIPAGAWVRLVDVNGLALGWSAGIKTQALKDGVNSLLGEFALDYLAYMGCTTFDFVGANIKPVAEMKEAWGGDLVTYYAVRPPTLRNLARETYLTARALLKKH